MNPNLESVRQALCERYAVEHELGRGGMASVYLARDLRHEREVAIKVLHPELAQALGPERFVREIKLIAGLQHPHILPLFDSGEMNGVLYYVMPCITGGSLRDMLRRDGPLPPGHALRIIREVASGLAHAHSRGILHRDIKPENILLADGHALLADFGVARSISHGGLAEHLTATGLIVGTPVYMSPEQASGEEDLDGRSDIYSLGVVLYEALTGQAPFAGSNLHELTVQRLVDPIVPVTHRRSDVPVELDAVLARTLAPARVDRYADATEFARALPEPSGIDARARQGRWRQKWRWSVPLGAAAAALVLLLVLPDLIGAPERGSAVLDESMYAVLPLDHRGGAAPALLDGAKCGLLLYDAMSRWQDIRLVDDLRLNDAKARFEGKARTLNDNIQMARGLGAGRLVAGQVFQLRDSIFVRASLYDVASARLIRENSVRIAADLKDAAVKFDRLAGTLLVGTGMPQSAVAGAMNTRNVSAWNAYERGHRALDNWQLDSSRAHFRDATVIDPEYPDAHLWLAEALIWSGVESTTELRRAAERAASLSATLTPRDRMLAKAHLALAEERFPQACAAYSAMRGRDSLDFSAWYGLAECHRRDRLVVRDAASPSGWRFRSSYRTAIRAYERALTLVPSSHMAFRGEAFERLRQILFAEALTLRWGHGASRDSVFGAFPSLAADTLAFVPQTTAELALARVVPRPSSTIAAVERNRESLARIVSSWVEAFPDSPDALAAHASVLELKGELRPTAAGTPSALTVLHRARQRARDADTRVRLAASAVRLRLKMGEFATARSIADSVLSNTPTPSPAQASVLAALAALTGHPHRAATLMTAAIPVDSFFSPRGQLVASAPPITAATRAMIAYASVGAPTDSILALERRIERLTTTWEAPARRQQVRDDALALPLNLAVPALGARAALRIGGPPTSLTRLQTAVARGDTSITRTELRDLARYRQTVYRGGDHSIENIYQEGWILAALGDSAGAMARLDLSLEALPTLGSRVSTFVPWAGALPRMMALRADLAVAADDLPTARRWASAVAQLWGGADPELLPVVRRMQIIASSR